MCYYPSPAGMRCSPSNLVFVRILQSSNELSFEDFSSFEYWNLRSKIFFESFALCSGVVSGAPNFCPSVTIVPGDHLPKVVHNWLSPQRRSVQRIWSRHHPLLAVWMTP